MTTDTITAPESPAGGEPPRSVHEPEANARRRRRKSQLVSAVLLGAMALAAAPLVIILWQVTVQAADALGPTLGGIWSFLTEVEPLSYRERGGGYAHGIFGTLYMTGLAAVMSIPLGIAAAIYLVDQGRGLFAKTVRLFTDVMTGVPSIFVGLAVYAILVTGLRFGTFVGAVALSIIMLPIIVRTAEEMLHLVPPDLRAASAGLGARQWQTTFKVVLPAAGPGLITGSMLAVARAAGETAPLILTAFGARTIVTAFQGGNGQADVGILMTDGMSQPFEEGIERAWAGGLMLVVIVLSLTVIARLINQRSQIDT
ncbi:phosphate ABC transporter permease PstA [Egibacter rhizosphaerae]|uniref:Phosphate transport system permease protein PstA n=1 Tax=Egibacter rhizosphaerae TaxID=1670831 RepID=A0A411YIU5_9ACTN|nr:phosphate ABC transporter permease PstA [Egibacter rhizosphaerae]QBI21160.1 phosphate ABC transporter permease PstA [Egibacter rhizosphaerae]